MIYGYARCSTNESMQDIDRQIRELIQQGAEDKTIYREYESGTKKMCIRDSSSTFVPLLS